MSLFGNGVGEPEREYLRISILRFKGESEVSRGDPSNLGPGLPLAFH